jgi:hypothetical protein
LRTDGSEEKMKKVKIKDNNGYTWVFDKEAEIVALELEPGEERDPFDGYAARNLEDAIFELLEGLVLEIGKPFEIEIVEQE